MSEDGVYRPSKHWCFFAEIIEVIPWPARPMFHVKDVIGNDELLVSFNCDERYMFPTITEACKVGSTICIMYANSHRFMDGQVGIRVESLETIYTVRRYGSPYALESDFVHCRSPIAASTLS